MTKYQIWDKTSPIYTPVGEVFTPEEWIDRYKWAAIPMAVPVIAEGLINGAFMGELSQMVKMYSAAGADFSLCQTNEEKLEQIEAWEAKVNAPRTEPTAEERTAMALETLASGQTTETAAAIDDLSAKIDYVGMMTEVL